MNEMKKSGIELIDLGQHIAHVLNTYPSLIAERDRYKAALEAARQTIHGLADQQAMPDDFWMATVEQIDEALKQEGNDEHTR